METLHKGQDEANQVVRWLHYVVGVEYRWLNNQQSNVWLTVVGQAHDERLTHWPLTLIMTKYCTVSATVIPSSVLTVYIPFCVFNFTAIILY